ncbi:MAG TPA: hypothetical protein DCP63_01045 [Bacteroidetes bacterium]|nr:hypothetical protein [Bacteroidota bacterium]
MPTRKKSLLARLKLPAFVFGVFFLLFLVLDEIVMPRYVQFGKTTRVPNVVGISLDDALRLLAENGLEGKKFDVRSDKQYPEGIVILQNPPADAEVKFGRGIYLTVSGGELLVDVPGLRGRSIRDATFALERKGLLPGTIRYETSEEYPQGTVIDQEIAEGSKVTIGRVINLIVSMGKSGERSEVPDVLKRSLTEAEQLLLQAGLRIGNVTFQLNAELLPNTVIDQYPRGGELVTPGQAIDLFVAKKGEKPVNEH